MTRLRLQLLVFAVVGAIFGFFVGGVTTMLIAMVLLPVAQLGAHELRRRRRGRLSH